MSCGEMRPWAGRRFTLQMTAFNEGPTHGDAIRLESGDEVALTWGIA